MVDLDSGDVLRTVVCMYVYTVSDPAEKDDVVLPLQAATLGRKFRDHP
jgi:hypothetical protein